MSGHKENALLGLRIICGLTIAIGLIGIVMSILYNQSVNVFFVTVPGWVVGASVAYLGIRHWRKIPALDKGIVENSRFSWSNFKGTFTWATLWGSK